MFFLFRHIRSESDAVSVSTFSLRLANFLLLRAYIGEFFVKTLGDSTKIKSFNDFSSFVTLSGMEVIGGLVTVLGGVSNTEFLSSVEVLDNSPDSDAPLGFEWRVTAHALTAPRYDFALAVAPVSSLSLEDRGMDDCSSNLEVIES